jgi:hypothetical protein
VEYSEQIKQIKKFLDTIVETPKDYFTILWMFILDKTYDRGAICQAIKEWERENEKKVCKFNEVI